MTRSVRLLFMELMEHGDVLLWEFLPMELMVTDGMEFQVL